MRMAAFAVRKAEGTPYDCLPTLSPAATRRLPGPLTRSMAFEPGSRVFDAFLAASCLSPLRRCAEAAFQASGAERHLLTLVCCDFPEARPSKGRCSAVKMRAMRALAPQELKAPLRSSEAIALERPSGQSGARWTCSSSLTFNAPFTNCTTAGAALRARSARATWPARGSLWLGHSTLHIGSAECTWACLLRLAILHRHCPDPAASAGVEWWTLCLVLCPETRISRCRACRAGYSFPRESRKECDADVGWHWDRDYVLEDSGVNLHPMLGTVTYLSGEPS